METSCVSKFENVPLFWILLRSHADSEVFSEERSQSDGQFALNANTSNAVAPFFGNILSVLYISFFPLVSFYGSFPVLFFSLAK